MRKTIGLSLALLVASTAALTKQAQSAEQPIHSGKTKSAKAAHSAPRAASSRHRTVRAAAARQQRRRSEPVSEDTAALPPPDQYLGPVQVIGSREIGSAAWYGGRHIGQRTATGERLDAIHATAAHRSLPLHSMVRVTNLRNGRSVIARINDRGPVSHSLLIDVSPRVADVLDMKRSGVATVAVEPVAPTVAAAEPRQR